MISKIETLKAGDGTLVRLKQDSPLNQPLLMSARFGEGQTEDAIPGELYLTVDLFSKLSASSELRHIGYSDYRISEKELPADGNNQCHVFIPRSKVSKALQNSETLTENGTQISDLSYEDAKLPDRSGFIFRRQGYGTLLCSLAFSILDHYRLKQVDFLAQSPGFQNTLQGFGVPEIRKPLRLSALLSSKRLQDCLERFF